MASLKCKWISALYDLLSVIKFSKHCHASGAWFEDQACRLLLRRGLRLKTRNYRCRYGEIDLVMREQEILVFVEVRARTHDTFGGAAASIDAAKCRRLQRSAADYLQRNFSAPPPYRFDAVVFDGKQTPKWLQAII